MQGVLPEAVTFKGRDLLRLGVLLGGGEGPLGRGVLCRRVPGKRVQAEGCW